MAPTEIKVALDWTPNTNHTGFYVAREKGWYADAGLSVSFISPHEDEYKATPASRLTDGSATFALTPSETVVSYHTWPDASKPKVVAVATLLQDSTSAIVTLKSSGIDRPAQLDGKNYASYGARFEGRIVQQMIKNDGGKGEFLESTPPMLGIWNTLLKGTADATWVFLGWEGIEAQMKGVELNAFKLEDYKVPYGYSPVLAAHPSTLSSSPDMVKAFLAATAKGYAWAAAQPAEAAALLVSAVAKDTATKPLPTPLDGVMVAKSQAWVAPHCLTADGRWGVMKTEQWESFVGWLEAQGLLTAKVQSREPVAGVSTTLDGLRAGDVGAPVARPDVAALHTNAFLPQ